MLATTFWCFTFKGENSTHTAPRSGSSCQFHNLQEGHTTDFPGDGVWPRWSVSCLRKSKPHAGIATMMQTCIIEGCAEYVYRGKRKGNVLCRESHAKRWGNHMYIGKRLKTNLRAHSECLGKYLSIQPTNARVLLDRWTSVTWPSHRPLRRHQNRTAATTRQVMGYREDREDHNKFSQSPSIINLSKINLTNRHAKNTTVG